MHIPFTKMQGLGNDFIVIDAVTHDISLSAESIRKISDRHFGVGCDQILVLEPPTKEQLSIDFTYRIFNADGSEAGQCGNGIRCLAKFVAEHGLCHKRDLSFATKSCRMQTHLENDGQITVTVGKPNFEPKDIPFVAEKKALRYNLPIVGYGEIEVGAVSVGNPHAVILLEGNVIDYIATLGSLVSNSKHFPERVNVNFMRILNREQIELRVYERGSGETLACGSGACAAVVIGRLWGLLDSKVLVKLLGGDLLIKWDKHSDNIQMTGPAKQVFNGEIILAR
jgi:diaminopimelate epimerase